jgi:hypothetical protein
MQVSVSIAGRQSQRMLGVVVIGETSPTAGSATSITSFGTPSPVVTQEDGTYALRGVRAGVELKIEAKGAVMKPAVVRLDALEPGQQKQGVDLVLTNGADLVVTRTLGDGDNIFDVRLEWAGPKPDSGRVHDEHEIMVEGSCKFTGLTPGSWLISLRDFSARDSAPPLIEPRPVQLRAGEENRVNLD